MAPWPENKSAHWKNSYPRTQNPDLLEPRRTYILVTEWEHSDKKTCPQWHPPQDDAEVGRDLTCGHKYSPLWGKSLWLFFLHECEITSEERLTFCSNTNHLSLSWRVWGGWGLNTAEVCFKFGVTRSQLQIGLFSCEQQKRFQSWRRKMIPTFFFLRRGGQGCLEPQKVEDICDKSDNCAS